MIKCYSKDICNVTKDLQLFHSMTIFTVFVIKYMQPYWALKKIKKKCYTNQTFEC